MITVKELTQLFFVGVKFSFYGSAPFPVQFLIRLFGKAKPCTFAPVRQFSLQFGITHVYGIASGDIHPQHVKTLKTKDEKIRREEYSSSYPTHSKLCTDRRQPSFSFQALQTMTSQCFLVRSFRPYTYGGHERSGSSDDVTSRDQLLVNKQSVWEGFSCFTLLYANTFNESYVIQCTMDENNLQYYQLYSYTFDNKSHCQW